MSENTLVLLSELIILIGHLKIYFCKIIQQCLIGANITETSHITGTIVTGHSLL